MPSLECLDCRSQGVSSSKFQLGHIIKVEIDHEGISKVIHPLHSKGNCQLLAKVHAHVLVAKTIQEKCE